MKKSILLASLMILFGVHKSYSQDDIAGFKNFQFSFNRVTQAWSLHNDSIAKGFKQRGVEYPNKNIFIRSFKASNELEIWAKNEDSSRYVLIKKYNICALSGVMGPKRIEGDRQVPEGFYYIDEFNPRSDFHLSMLVNYPNYSDLLLSDKKRPGGDIYIHGGCFTIGCIPLTDFYIQELYTICLNAKLAGQNYIPIHIFPTRFDRKGLEYLGRNFMSDQAKQAFWINLKKGYDYFEQSRKLPPVIYDPKGEYIF